MKGFLAGVIVTLVAIACAIVAVSYFGLYPIGADNPPSAIESSLSMRAMDTYADKHKPDGDNPVPSTPANLGQGAQLYEQRCALCHGGANPRVSLLQHHFNPPVPQLVEHVPDDPPSWIFWVTKHGVRMTGMPAWTGVLSDDQIWKIAAFLKQSDKLPPDAAAAWQAAAAPAAR